MMKEKKAPSKALFLLSSQNQTITFGTISTPTFLDPPHDTSPTAQYSKKNFFRTICATESESHHPHHSSFHTNATLRIWM
jgi:hypothetical protein